MARRKKAKIVRDRPLQEWTPHELQVIGITQEDDERSVLLRHVASEHAGHTHVFRFRSPLAIGGLGATFLRACGLTVRVNEEVDPREVVGRTVRARFLLAPDGTAEIAMFEPVKESTDDPDSQPESAARSTNDAIE